MTLKCNKISDSFSLRGFCGTFLLGQVRISSMWTTKLWKQVYVQHIILSFKVIAWMVALD